MLKSLLIDHNPVAHLTSKIISKLPPLAQLSDYLRSLFFPKANPNLQKLLFLLGIGALTYKTIHFCHKMICTWGWIPFHLINSANLSGQNLKKKYGNCYVAITGFTQGIGRAYAQIFAQYGFNLLLIGMDEQTVKRRVFQFRSYYPKIKLEYIVVDLSKKEQIQGLKDNLAKLAHLDIGILINNAGCIHPGQAFNVKPQHILSDFSVDLVASITINSYLLNRLRSRQCRSALIHMSSISGVHLMPNLGVYCPAKKSLDIYSRILAEENKDKIDVLSVRPFGVSTLMSGFLKGPASITPRQCVKGILADLLGGKRTTFGHFEHKAARSFVFAGLNDEQCFTLLSNWKGLKK